MEWSINGEFRKLPGKPRTRDASAYEAKLLDPVNLQLLEELSLDGRVGIAELARRIGMSPPAVAERVQRLERAGVITGYRADVDPGEVGIPLTAFLQLRCETGHCLLKNTAAEDFPEVAEIHKLSGSFCTMLKVRATSMAHLEGLIERLGEHRNMNSHVVLSTQYEHRTVEPPPELPRTVSEPTGWRRG